MPVGVTTGFQSISLKPQIRCCFSPCVNGVVAPSGMPSVACHSISMIDNFPSVVVIAIGHRLFD